MTQYLLAFVVMFLAVLGLAVGILAGRKPIAGSCGGIGGGACASCSKACSREKHEGST